MLSLLSAIFMTATLWAAPATDVTLEGHRLNSSDGRSFLVLKMIASGQHGDIYTVAQRIGDKWFDRRQVVKALEFDGDKEQKAEILENHRAALGLISQSKLFLPFEYLVLPNYGTPDAVLLMPRIDNTLMSELPNVRTIEQRIALAKQVFIFSLEVADVLIKAGSSHRDFSLNNIARLQNGEIILFDYDSTQRIGKKSNLHMSGESAPELLASGRASATTDIYSMGMELTKILVVSSYSHLHPASELPTTLRYLRATINDKAALSDFLALETFILAAQEKNPTTRQLKVQRALHDIREKNLLGIEFSSQLIELENTLSENAKKSGFISPVVRFCRGVFGY